MKFGFCLWLLTAAFLKAAEPTTVPSASKTNAPATNSIPRQEVLKNSLLKRGFRMDSMVSESLVTDPVAIAFDENGRLFVLESPGNLGPAGAPTGRLKVLEDTDGDGVFDKSSIYAIDFEKPSALICYGGGVYVAAGDQIIYLKDKGNSGKASERTEVFRGFGEPTNGIGGQILITSMAWGLDNRIHVGTAGRGGDIFSSNNPKRSTILTEGNFAFDPRTLEMIPESGSATTGMAFDSRGRKYVSTPNQHIAEVVYEGRYATRNVFYKMPATMLDIGPDAAIYPAHAATGSPAKFTTATGLLIYRGNAFPVDYWENAFVIDSLGGLVHRDKLRTAGIEVFAERSPDEAGFEFFNAKDSRLQPVQLANAPDGTLYVVGSEKQKKNATNTALAGFIFRVAPVTFKALPMPTPGKATTAQLVAYLTSANGWLRDTASRLLFERQEKAAIAPLTQLAFDAQASPIARLHAVHALAGLQALTTAELAKLLGDADERIKEHAILLAENLIGLRGTLPDIVANPLLALAGDVSPRVRCQLAYTLGTLKHPRRAQALTDCLVRDPANRWIQNAVMCSAGDDTGNLFSALAASPAIRGTDATRDMLRQLVEMIGLRNQGNDATVALNQIVNIPEADLAFYLALSLNDGLQKLNSSLASVDVQGALTVLYGRAAGTVQDAGAAEKVQMQAMRVLQSGRVNEVQVAFSLLNRWRTLSAPMRMDAVVSMLIRTERAAVLVTGLERGIVPYADLTSVQIRFLLSHRDPIIRQRALALFGAMVRAQNRPAVVANFANATQMGGSAERGHNVYSAKCAICHQLGGDGNPIGKDLADAGKMTRERLLIKILDPNRDLPRNAAQTLINTREDTTLMGFISEQSDKSVTLCQPNGAGRVIGRQNIAGFDTLAISAMPDGLEAGLNAQDLADLMEYLKPSVPAGR